MRETIKNFGVGLGVLVAATLVATVPAGVGWLVLTRWLEPPFGFGVITFVGWAVFGALYTIQWLGGKFRE